MRSPEELRQNLAQTVLNVRSGRATSRRKLADVMHLSPTTSGYYVDQLIASGHLYESGFEQGGKGRPKRSLEAAAGAGWFAGVEFNAERIQTVCIDFSGSLVAKDQLRLPTDADAREVMAALVDVINTLAKRATGPLLGIGIGAPGIVDPDRGIGVDYSFLLRWKDVEVAAPLHDEFKVPVTLENNLRAIALAERWFGGGRELSDFVVLGPRSGFGLSIVKDGRLVGGAHHAAGEIGRWPWPLTAGMGAPEMQQMLCAPAIYRRLAGLGARDPLPEDLRSALRDLSALEGDPWNQVIDDYARVIGCVHLLLDPQVFFLHGPLTSLGQRFCDDIMASASGLMPALTGSTTQLVPSTLGDDAGALGAASLAMEAWAP